MIIRKAINFQNSSRLSVILICSFIMPWLQMAALGAENKAEIGSDGFNVEISCNADGIYEAVTDGQHKVTSVPWTLCIDGNTVTPENGSIELTLNDKDEVVVKGSNKQFDWTLRYSINVASCVTKTLSLKPHKQLLLNSVSLWNAKSESQPVIAGTSLLDICAFYRGENTGFFVSLDFPYSKIKSLNGLWCVTYPPNDELKAGETYTCHSLTIGRSHLTKNSRYGFDDGEVEAMDNYIQTRYKPRFNRPMTIAAGINNRYTQPADGEIFYTMKDNPTLSWHTDSLEKDIKLMAEIGVEYYQVWPGPFDAVCNDPDPKYVKKFVKYANNLGVRVGDYSATEQLFCEHYNFYNNTLASYPEWNLSGEDCHFGNKKFVDFYITKTTEYCKKYGFEEHCLDFLKIGKRGEGAAGEEIIYAQVRGLTQVLEAINNVSDNMMTWSNSGVWAELLPKIAWYNHNLYLTDPYMDKPWQDLNMTRLLDDVRREQMVSLHYSRFIPYRYFSNLQYFFCQNSIVPDTSNYQYGALSTLGVVGNLGFGELRFWMETLPAAKQQSVIAFYKKWLGLIKDNYDIWTTTYNAGDKPGIGSAEIYGHARDNKGYIFLVNSNYWDRNVIVPLNEKLGFKGNGLCEIKQLYPDEKLCLTNFGPLVNLGQQIKFNIPARQVIVLQVQPASAKASIPKVYGIPAVVESTENGYQLKTTGPQGTTQRFTVCFPQNYDINDVNAIVRADIPKQRQRSWKPTRLTVISKDQQCVLYEITFRQKIAPRELSKWKVSAVNSNAGKDANYPNGFAAGDSYDFPLFNEVAGINYPMWPWDGDSQGFGALANFCGGYIENSFSEDQETYIELTTSKNVLAKCEATKQSDYDVNVPPAQPLPSIAKDAAKNWWLQNDFDLPFMYGFACEPALQEHMFVVLPFLSSAKIKNIEAWINGQAVVVQEYKYPRNRSLGTYYIDLVGTTAHSGSNRIVLYFEQN